MGLVNRSGSLVAQYNYDAWGKITSQTTSTIAQLNPLRYRGYVYDDESGLYYCQSRYYDPTTGRFVNADCTCILEDTVGEIHGTNLFAYCANNPVMYYDPDGCIFIYTLSNGKYTISGSYTNPTWDTTLWGIKQSYANCYAYALNIYGNVKDHKLQPGQLSGKIFTSYSGSYKDKLVAAFKADLKKLGLKCSESILNAPWSYNNGYLVALVYSSYTNGDYHWYRLDHGTNGIWSHKRGLTAITRKDASGNTI